MKKIIYTAIVLFCTKVALAQIPFYEAFDNNSQQWAFIDGNSMSIANGHLVIRTADNALQTFKYVNFKGEKDFEINARMVFLGGDNTDLCAIRWGMSDDGKQYYVFGYADEGKYYIGKYDGKLKSIVNFLSAPSVKQKDYNLLQIKKEGEKYLFKINGVVVYGAKNLPWFSDGLAIKCPAGSRMMVDYVSITDPEKEKASSSKISDILFAGTMPSKTPPKKSQPLPEAVITSPAISGSQEFKEFMKNFEQIEFIHKIHPGEKKLKGEDITNLPFIKQLYSPKDNTILALGKISDCADGYILLLANREKNPQAENTDFILHKFSASGTSMGSQKIGRTEYMNKRYFLMTDMDFYKKGNIITVSVTKYYDREHKQNSTITFNQNFCTF
ncbi:MAG: hypothetical protein H7Y13_10100 [Sphingobacteriaceae bacterium]|nr:hypothetical protein [Sphingobacteriaceae bacterium]